MLEYVGDISTPMILGTDRVLRGDCGAGFTCAGVTLCGGEHGNTPCDALNNTYSCLRTMNSTENSIFCEFNDTDGMVEYYDINADPHELDNLHHSADPSKKAALAARLQAFRQCAGSSCFNPTFPFSSTDVDPVLPAGKIGVV